MRARPPVTSQPPTKGEDHGLSIPESALAGNEVGGMKRRIRDVARLAAAFYRRVEHTRGGHLRLVHESLPPILTGSTPSDHRAQRRLLADLRKASRGVPL